MGVIIPKLRASAKGQDCTLRSCFCNWNNETTVLAHFPSEVKGMGNKSDDWNGCFACAACHAALDQHRLGEGLMLRAWWRTLKFWIDNGYLVIPGVLNTRAKPSNKIMPSKEMYR